MPKTGLTEDVSMSVGGIIEAIDRNQFQPIGNLVEKNIPLDREPVFFGVLQEDAAWVAPVGMLEPLRGLHETRFELVRAASVHALRAYTEGW